MTNYFDRQGKPLDGVLDWAQLYQQNDYRIVARTECPNGTVVSTIWLGFSMDATVLEAPGNIFETALLVNDEVVHMQRTATEAQALEAHATEVRGNGIPTFRFDADDPTSEAPRG